jgi:gluconolactonase
VLRRLGRSERGRRALLYSEGDLLGKIHIPETVANLCFGGQQRNRLYICGSTSLYAVYTSVQGAMKP